MLNVGNRIVNNWIYSIQDGYVLVDTGYEKGFTKLKKQLAVYNIDLQDIKYIFLTHAHDDHAGFLNEVLAYSLNTKVVMSYKALDTLYKGQNSFIGGCTSRISLFFCNVMKLVGKGEHRFPKLDPCFEDRCILVSDDTRRLVEKALCGRIIDTPGHTADSISLILNDGSLFCGDAAMNGLPSLNRITIWAEDKESFLQSWLTIISIKPKKIYPGHGKPFNYTELNSNIEKVRRIKMYSLT